jgi:CelD/BcsL family acetyltransferase involved in cellulose biosynthesis
MHALNAEVGSFFHLEMAVGNCITRELREGWRSLSGMMERPESLHQSLDFFEHLQKLEPGENLVLGALRDETAAIAGVIPLRVRRVPLTFHIQRCVLWEFGLRGVQIIGGVPRIPDDPALFDLLFNTLDEMFPTCNVVALEYVPTESLLWDYLNQSKYINDNFITYSWNGINNYHAIELPDTFEEYLAQYKPRYRRNIKRQIRLLRELGGGRLELRKIDARDQIVDLLAFVRALDWPGEHLREMPLRYGEFTSLAERGLFLAYLLFCGEIPCAAVIGAMYKNTYRIEPIARNRSFDRFSPGTTILQLLIEDLIRGGRVARVELGVGWPRYRHSATNVTWPCASVYLLRKTLTNRLLKVSHETFRSLKRWVRSNVIGPVQPGERLGGPGSRRAGRRA